MKAVISGEVTGWFESILILAVAFVFFQLQPALHAAQTPFKGVPFAIPGIIQAEDFEEGGEGISYHDTTTTNEGVAYRATGVDIYPDSIADAGYYVRMVEGEWLEFTVVVSETGLYDIRAYRSCPYLVSGNFRLTLDGQDIAGQIEIHHFDGDRSPSTRRIVVEEKEGIVLKAGQQVLKLHLDHLRSVYPAVYVDFGYLDITRSDLSPHGGARFRRRS